MTGRGMRRGRGKAGKSLRLIEVAYDILSRIQPASVRAVCYQLFNAKLIPDMSKASTNRVGTQLVWARKEGMIPWAWIVDETREAERVSAWDDPASFAETVQRSYRRDYWAAQPQQVEVWSEKGTVRGTLAPILCKYGVTFRVMHGYSSATTVNAVAEETRNMEEPLVALYVGDYDPSGLHMSEADLPGRLAEHDANVEVIRVALTDSHVKQGGLPSFEADTKARDPRYQWFVKRYGRTCWELDAMDPPQLRDEVEEHILGLMDVEYWARCKKVEQVERESLVEIMGRWKESISVQALK